MNETDSISKEMRENLKEFNTTHQEVLAQTAQTLAAQGIRKVHYGMDYVNDDGDAANYAVVEYNDGRSEEQDSWFNALEIDVFLWGLRYCQAYTFDVASARVEFDVQGGMVDAEENVIRAYHSQTRREQLEHHLATVVPLQEFSFERFAAFERLCKTLKKAKISAVHFGVNFIAGEYQLARWGRVLGENQNTWLEEFPTQLQNIHEDLQNDLPSFGAFAFDAEDGMVIANPEGGLLELDNGDLYAYDDESHLERLKAQHPE